MQDIQPQQSKDMSMQTINWASVLDERLYAPLEELLEDDFPLHFDRLSNGGIDVVLQEGPYTTYIAEKPSYAKRGQYFPLELSFCRRGTVYAGWLLDSPAHYFLLYCPLEESLHALLVSKERLLRELARRGFDRAAMADRDELIRKGRWPGVYQTADPDVSFAFGGSGGREAVSLRVSARALEAIAAGNFVVPLGDGQEPMAGKWMGQELMARQEGLDHAGRAVSPRCTIEPHI